MKLHVAAVLMLASVIFVSRADGEDPYMDPDAPADTTPTLGTIVDGITPVAGVCEMPESAAKCVLTASDPSPYVGGPTTVVLRPAAGSTPISRYFIDGAEVFSPYARNFTVTGEQVVLGEVRDAQDNRGYCSLPLGATPVTGTQCYLTANPNPVAQGKSTNLRINIIGSASGYTYKITTPAGVINSANGVYTLMGSTATITGQIRKGSAAWINCNPLTLIETPPATCQVNAPATGQGGQSVSVGITTNPTADGTFKYKIYKAGSTPPSTFAAASSQNFVLLTGSNSFLGQVQVGSMPAITCASATTNATAPPPVPSCTAIEGPSSGFTNSSITVSLITANAPSGTTFAINGGAFSSSSSGSVILNAAPGSQRVTGVIKVNGNTYSCPYKMVQVTAPPAPTCSLSAPTSAQSNVNFAVTITVQNLPAGTALNNVTYAVQGSPYRTSTVLGSYSTPLNFTGPGTFTINGSVKIGTGSPFSCSGQNISISAPSGGSGSGTPTASPTPGSSATPGASPGATPGADATASKPAPFLGPSIGIQFR